MKSVLFQAYSRNLFSGMKHLARSVSTPLCMGCQPTREVPPALKLIYTWAERGIVGVKCAALEHITINGINVRKKSQLCYDIKSTRCYSSLKQTIDLLSIRRENAMDHKTRRQTLS